MDLVKKLEEICLKSDLRMTNQRRVIAEVLMDSDDHPSIEVILDRAKMRDSRVSLPTVYRTVKLLEDADMLEKHLLKDGRTLYEDKVGEHHDHLIDVTTGDVVEFVSEEIEALQEAIADKLGYKLVDHRLELYAIPKNPK
ncbi:MAG: transcriptional repressor [Alphaproteobacteria bacterium]|jgi:Fur family ferric uptake transcriptional regulator|nr:transcriptional repressor [Alphaproteobacteria bacterium]